MAGPPSNLAEIVFQRGEFLVELVGEVRRKPELAESLSVSRSTVDRALRSLEGADLVTREDGGFTATVAGRLAARTYEEYCAELDTLSETTTILGHLPSDCDLPRALLRGADVMLAQQPAPYRPGDELNSYLHDADCLLALSRSITDSSTSDTLAKQVEEGLEYRAIYETELAEFLCRGRGQERSEMVASGRFEAYATDDVPYGLFVFENDRRTTVALVVYDETDALRGVILNDREEAVEWARDTWQRYRDEAMPITDVFAEARSLSGDVSSHLTD